jgi:hypothetical protein
MKIIKGLIISLILLIHVSFLQSVFKNACIEHVINSSPYNVKIATSIADPTHYPGTFGDDCTITAGNYHIIPPGMTAAASKMQIPWSKDFIGIIVLPTTGTQTPVATAVLNDNKGQIVLSGTGKISPQSIGKGSSQFNINIQIAADGTVSITQVTTPSYACSY